MGQLIRYAKSTVSIIKGEQIYFESGGQQLQVTITVTSGHQLRINEGSLAFANAKHIRPGDEIMFEYGYEATNTWENQKGEKISFEEFKSIGKIEIIAVGEFSDVPDKILVDAGRKPLEFTEKHVKSKNQSVPPLPHKEAPVDGVGTGGTGTKENNAADDNPFQEDGH